ncbi:hypothetical protein [Dactylosporangium sp. NPDC051484]|uniref:hypothetical protein n=1 Tax=Dactylosporangium sp. NPDC051484 TaxID=3154942 RepID=UPI00344C53A5
MNTLMSWRRRALIGLVAGLVVASVAELGHIAAASADEDPSVGKIEYTGTPVTDSAVTRSGDSAFANLRVTVSQTKNLTSQAVTVTWTGLGKFCCDATHYASNYLQIMQCWGDDPAAPAERPAPARETCQFGAYTGTDPGQVGNPPDIYARSRSVLRTDADERAAAGPDGKPLNYYLNAGGAGGAVPFRPATGAAPVIPGFGLPIDMAGGKVFGVAETNEQPYVLSRPDGTGEAPFEIQTTLESPSLGCGAIVGDPSHPAGRPCWLVVVPRGTTDDGYRTGAFVGEGGLTHVVSSPLTMSTWKHRLAFRLEFKPVGEQCPLGTAQRRIVGSEIVKPAFLSWSPALCASSNVPYNLTTLSETAARNTIVGSTPGATRAALISRPLARDAAHPVSYAPIALSGVAIGFNIERRPGAADTPQAEMDIAGSRLPRLNLTPRVVAKLLTESYAKAVPPPSRTKLAPDYLTHNPGRLFDDPEVLQANPEVKWLAAPATAAASAAPLTVLENSDATWTLWQWINADPDARKFLDGTPDPWGMTVNPAYKNVTLPIENFPKSDPTCTELTDEERAKGATSPRCVIDVSPFAESLGDAARRTRAGNPGGASGEWWAADDPTNATGVGQWKKDGPQFVGSRFVVSITSTAEAAKYGLQTARLRNAAGKFVAPDEVGLQAGANAMIEDRDEHRVKVANPASTAPDAYPLPMLTYAAVSVADIDAADAQARTDLAAFVDYAANAGQTRGLADGQLPPGYSPLPFALRLQAKGAVQEIRSGKVAGYDQTAQPTQQSGTQAGGTGTGTTRPASTAASGLPDRGSIPSAAPSRSTRGPEPVAVVQSGRTPDDPSTLPPWVLLAGLGAGVVSAFAAPLVRPRRRSIDP